MEDKLLLNKRVLVAEANRIHGLKVDQVLRDLGAKTDIVENATDIIENIRNKDYDIVLMEIHTPVFDSYETAQYIRKHLQTNVPIIAMASSDMEGEDQKCFEAGMNAYITAPFDPEVFKNIINDVLFHKPGPVNNHHILIKNDVAVDISMLYDVAANDEVYVQLMVSTFLENMPVTIATIEQSFKEKNYENLYQTAHYAKSSLSIVKINEMLEWAQKIEAAAKYKSDVELLPALIEKVKTRFSVAQQLLSAKFQPAYNSPI
jgi:CheY-like chemotaxis protein